MLKPSLLTHLHVKKNLLAFSAGGDSTALLFLLLKHNIKFDIAIVDYGLRIQSKEEVKYAQELASMYKIKCHVLKAECIEKNFEANARKIRYDFFEELAREYSYENILTAHHLGDRFEWMLMQFCKGAGCAELNGMQEIQERENYKLIRPLLHVDKKELLKYLHVGNIRYFEDETNSDENIKRNSFRHNYSEPLLEKYLEGIKKSFNYIDEDVDSLIETLHVEKIREFAYFKNSHNSRSDIFTIDKYLKLQKHMITAKERELLKNETCLIVGRKFVVNQTKKYVFICPYIEDNFKLSKEFKEVFRTLQVEPKLRKYLAKNGDIFELVKELLTAI